MEFNLLSNDDINKIYYESVLLISKIVNKLSDRNIDLEEILNLEESLTQNLKIIKQHSNKK